MVRNQWTHVALVYDKVNLDWVVYQDGKVVSQVVASGWGSYFFDTDGYFVIGRSYILTGIHSSSVTIDDLMFFDRVLSQEEIQGVKAIYQNP